MDLTASRPGQGRISGLKPEIYGPGLWHFTALGTRVSRYPGAGINSKPGIWGRGSTVNQIFYVSGSWQFTWEGPIGIIYGYGQYIRPMARPGLLLMGRRPFMYGPGREAVKAGAEIVFCFC